MWDIKNMKTPEELQMAILENAARTSEPLYQASMLILAAFNGREDNAMKSRSPSIKAALAIAEAKAFIEEFYKDAP